MGRFAWTLLAGFALGTPAVPIGISLSLPGPVALVAVLLGAAGCVVFAVFAMERLRLSWQEWRVRWNSAAVPAGSGQKAAFGMRAGSRTLSGLWDIAALRPRREDRGAAAGLISVDAAGVGPSATDARLSGGTGRRARRVLDRYGVVGFGLIGPALFGTWGSALLGAALGIPRWALIRALMAGIALWCTVLLFASDAAFDFFGIG